MKTLAVSTTNGRFETDMAALHDISPQLCIVFADRDCFADETFLTAMKSLGDQAHVIGCSSAGEISAQGVSSGYASILALHFETTEVKCATAALAEAAQSFEAGRQIAEALIAKPGLKGVFILSPGLNVNGSAVAKGLHSLIPPEVKVTGGLAGDRTDFNQTQTFLDGALYSDRIVAFGLYGDDIVIGSGSRGGWRPFGPSREVTRVENNVLYELDGKPALDLYKTYLAEKAGELPASGLLYPLSIVDKDSQQATGLIRTILNINEADKSLILAGDLPLNCDVRLMHADIDALVEGSTAAAEEASLPPQGRSPDVALMVSCVGRRLVMGHDVDEEIDVIVEKFGAGCAYAGFYSYGELSPFGDKKKTELHNQTMTITTLYERTS